jgi:hypothetical protein
MEHLKHFPTAFIKQLLLDRRWWLTPLIRVIQEAVIRRITVQSQPREIVLETDLENRLVEWIKV